MTGESDRGPDLRPEPDLGGGSPSNGIAVPVFLGTLGFAASVVLWVVSSGSNDIIMFREFARFIEDRGLSELYRAHEVFNHPPLMGWYALLCLKVSALTGISFPIVCKFVPLLSHLGSALLLALMWQRRGGRRQGAWAFCLYSWGLCPILIAAYHGNTDPICVFFCLLAVHLLSEPKKPLHAGLALAAAVNVKIIPLLLVLPLLSSSSWKEAKAFGAGLTFGAIPFLGMMLGSGVGFLDNVLGYQPILDLWGVYYLLHMAGNLPGLTGIVELAPAYSQYGKYLILALILVLAAYQYRTKRFDVRFLAAGTMALFLLFASGFGVQYTVYLAPLITAVSIAWGVAYCLVAGAFLAQVYLHFLNPGMPISSAHTGPYPVWVAHSAFLTWLLVLGFLVLHLRAPQAAPVSRGGAA